MHEKYFPTFKYYLEQYGYYDIFLMDPDHGDVSFTVTKETDFGTRMSEVDSPLREVWRIAAKEGRTAISDTKPYAPSGGAPAQFVAAPIKKDGKVIGVVALHISMDAVNAIMSERSGLGKTGETYLVGSDKRMRSDSYQDPTGHSVEASFAGIVENNGVNTEASQNALAGKSGTEILVSFHGDKALSC